MRLEFSILWFDDNEDYFDSLDIDGLAEDIFSWGFTPVINTVSTAEDFNAHSPFDSHDLIVVDQNLEGYPDGQNFIEDIRNHEVFTEIIFYTAGNASKLWDSIREKELEGVFVSPRPNILSKIVKVGRQSIRKILDLENMRGIVMAEVGELDHLLGEILNLGINKLPNDQQENIFQRFYEKAKDQSAGNEQRLDEFIKSPATQSMLSFCDSNKRWENFNRLRGLHPILKEHKKIGDYVVEVLHPRNFLAHGRPKKNGDDSFTFLFQEKEYHFNGDVSRTLRQTILKYKHEFSSLVDVLNKKQQA